MPGLVIVDTSCLYCFCELNKQDRLKALLGDHARITLEVEREVRDNVSKVRHLEELLDEPLWPERVALSEAQLAELLGLAKDERRVLGGFSREDLGEISTVMWARDSGSTAIVDDRLGRHLAVQWDVPYRRGHHLIPGMVSLQLLTDNEGWALWRRFLSNSSRSSYEAACRDYRERNP